MQNDKILFGVKKGASNTRFDRTVDRLREYFPEPFRPDPGTVWHYTSQAGLKGILESKQIWMTKIQFLNDSKELKLALDFFLETLEASPKDKLKVHQRRIWEIKNIIEGFEFSPVYVSSFSELRDSLGQWRAYSGTGVGYSLGFSTMHLIYLAENLDAMFSACIYQPTDYRKIVERFLTKQLEFDPTLKAFLAYETNENDTRLISFVNDFMLLAPFIKDSGFKDEGEWRFVWRLSNKEEHSKERVRLGQSMLIPYVELPLILRSGETSGIQGVVLGPCPHPKLSIESVRSALLRNGISSFSVLGPSTVPFRNW